MGDVVNLRQARKVKARADKERLAGMNRARFGRTKAERRADAVEEERKARLIDGARLDGSGPQDD